MNEKIQELAKQAEEYANQFAYVQAIGFPGHKEMLNEKFAELIVKECAEYANWYQANSRYTDIAKAIKEHFGIQD